MCGSAPPTGSPVDISEYGCATVCSGNSAECGGSPHYGIVYHCPTCSSGSGSSSVIVYSTTDSSGSTYVTSRTSFLPIQSTSVAVYTTTDSKGSTYVTSSTSTFPVATPSVSVTVYTTTNSQGSTYVTSSTSTAPITMPTVLTGPSVVLVTTTGTIITTDTGGSTVTTVQTQTSSSTATTTTSLVPTASAGTCPGAGHAGDIYSDASGNQYQIYCGTDFPGNDLPAVHVNSLPDCLTACDQYVPSPSQANGAACVAISYGAGNVGGNCYLKSTITAINYGDGGLDSARMVGFNPQTPPMSESLSPPAGSGTATGWSTGSNTPPPASIISGTTSTGTLSPSAAAFPCPDYDGKYYIDSTQQAYGIECSTSYPGNDLTTPHTDTMEDCIAACDNYVPSPSVGGGKPCIAFSWGQGNVGGNCYLKSAIGTRSYGDGGVDSGYKYGYQGSASSGSSTPGSTSASTPTGSGTTTSSPTVASSTNSGMATSSSLNNGYGLGSSTSGSATTSPSPSATSSSSSSTSSSASTTSTTSQTGTTPVTTPTSTNTPDSGTTTSTTPTSGTGTTSAEPTVATAFCPSNNNTRFTDVFGTTFEVRCGLQVDGNNAHPAHADTFAKCLEYCDILEGCAAVTYQDGASAVNSNCYPYSSFRYYSTAGPAGLFSGVPVNGPTTGGGVNNQLCPQDNQTTFPDRFGNTYNIGCDQTITGSDLYATVADTLEGCLTYCSTYNTCVAVTWTGVTTGNGANCYPKSSSGTVSYQGGIQYASLH